jgi:sulfite reductase alpha subunit-like flavoprotein
MGRPSRIYDALREKAEEMAQFLMDDAEMGTKGGLLYACGDVKNMSRELWACLSEILQEQRGKHLLAMLFTKESKNHFQPSFIRPDLTLKKSHKEVSK